LVNADAMIGGMPEPITRPRVRLSDPDKLRRALRLRYPDEPVTERGYARMLGVTAATWHRVASSEIGCGGMFIAAVLTALPGTRFERWFEIRCEPANTKDSQPLAPFAG
jgi:hypothetical protein